MKSNVCKIENGTQDLAAILREGEKVAVYNELDRKQTLQLRLLCEELDGMLPKIIDEFEGDFWIELEDGVCKLNASILFAEFSSEKKRALVGIAKNKKNAAVTGIVGKIRSVIEDFFLDGELVEAYSMAARSFQLSTGHSEGMDYSYLWSLEEYRGRVARDTQNEEWDELEKSVIASVADDVIVGVKGRRADIIIVKKFA